MTALRPFKIWSSDRKVKKSLVAKSLQDLESKCKSKLGYSGSLKVVLEYDGTLVDDEDYFQFIDDNSTLMIIRQNEKWTPATLHGEDETDHINSGGENSKIEELSKLLRHDMAKIVTLSPEDLQLLVNTESNELSQLLGSSLSDVQSIQSACQRFLDEKQQASEAMQLLKLLATKAQDSKSQASNSSDADSESNQSSHKRQKTH